jgi:LEA14-like dessication related protein
MLVYHGTMRAMASAGVLLLATTIGCAGWFAAGEPPDVLVTNIAPLDSTAFEQRLQVGLRIRNPNDHDLQVTGMDFRLDLNGTRLARGLSNQDFAVPRLGEAVVTVETSTSMLDIVRQVLGLRTASRLAYAISGVLYVQGGKLPFEHAGLLLDKAELSGTRPPP